MAELDPKKLIIIASLLLVIGVVLPILMVMQILESTFFLNFFAFGSSTLGLLLGMIGALSLAVRNRKR
jgi:hypothetical protein